METIKSTAPLCKISNSNEDTNFAELEKGIFNLDNLIVSNDIANANNKHKLHTKTHILFAEFCTINDNRVIEDVNEIPVKPVVLVHIHNP